VADQNRGGFRLSGWDRFLISLFPDYGIRRVRARAAARHFEAAQGGRRTSGWQRTSSDANAANGPALTALRELSRDLRRNNGWARRGVQAIVNNTVGWGIMPKPKAGTERARNAKAIALWNAWADSPACDFDGRMNFYGLQRLAMETIVESGEVLILRQPAATRDNLPIPMRLQVLEPDYIDTSKSGDVRETGGKVIDGIEFDAQGRRVAYWLFASHPGSRTISRFESVRVSADRVLHVYRVDRPGQVRGVGWLAAAITRLKDLDDFEDAELMQQKVAACFGAFVTDVDAAGSAIGEQDEDDDELEHLEPGHIAYLPPGKNITFAQPPAPRDGAFSSRALRRIAVSLGVTYEDLTGDYSQVNYSSARMARLAHWGNVTEWREHMLMPQLCTGVWAWAMEFARELEGWTWATTPAAQWAAPPMPILEPDKEGLAYQRLVRIGAMTWGQMVRELGYDPIDQLIEIEDMNKELDARRIVLDIDPRKMTSAGQQQAALPAPGAPAKDQDDEVDQDEDSDQEAADNVEPESADAPPPAKKEPKKVGDSNSAEPVKVFAYHQPFMKAKEIREGIGLAGDVEDGELFALEFVAKHGGAAASDDAEKATETKGDGGSSA
jgi:lambda family phage portal protein